MMKEIQLLSHDTIDKIAAGEVVEKPASVVKELVENAIDAGAALITIEIKKGGMSMIRISDNGSGIHSSQVRKAFLRHQTSKLSDASQLTSIKSLGFRGEALSSIAAVSKVELITKTEDELLGTLIEIEGAREVKFEEIGAADGSTFIVRDLFYNTPARKKFLKSARAEGNYVIDMVEKLMLSHPEVAMQLTVDGKSKLTTIGSGKLKDTIYQVYGRNVASNLIKIDMENDPCKATGYICNSTVYKGNRSYENIFVNGRFVKCKELSKAVESAYSGYLMQHQYPFFVLMLDIDTTLVDVNVHPTKLNVRIERIDEVAGEIQDAVSTALRSTIDIRDYKFCDDNALDENAADDSATLHFAKAAESGASSISDDIATGSDMAGASAAGASIDLSDGFSAKVGAGDCAREVFGQSANNSESGSAIVDSHKAYHADNDRIYEPYEVRGFTKKKEEVISEVNKAFEEHPIETGGEQISFLSREAISDHKIIGQLFGTYWLVEYDNSLYMIDQHAAHEKVLYEHTLSLSKNHEMSSQMITPPIIVTLNSSEEAFLRDNIEVFRQLGYEIEHFGGHEYALSGVPYNIYGVDPKSLFMDMISNCVESAHNNSIILDKIASMSCKAAVKGSTGLAYDEAVKLIDDLLSLDNPFHCPHGRPTIVKMTKYEIDKRFGRIQ